jgi:Flp pilus assembly protein TadG
VAAVELAFVLPLLAFLCVIAIDYGRVFYYSLTVVNCARNGALYASDPFAPTESPYTSLKQAALADAGNLTPAPTVTSTSGTDVVGNPYVAVTASYTFETITHFPGVPQSVTIVRTVQMRTEPVIPN